jgi:hypothetical protein
MRCEQSSHLVANGGERGVLDFDQLAGAHSVDAKAFTNDFLLAVVAGVVGF